MRASIIPSPQLEAIAAGCPGFREAMLAAINDNNDPEIRVHRVAPEGYDPRWYVEVRTYDGSRRVLLADMSQIHTAAAIVPIYLVDHVQSVREEFAALFALPGFEEGVEMVIPFATRFGRGKPS